MHLRPRILKYQPRDRRSVTSFGGRAQLADPAEIRSRAHHATDQLHAIELKIAGAQKCGDRLSVEVIALSLPGSAGGNIQTLQAQAVSRQRVRFNTAFNFVIVALAGNHSREVAAPAQGSAGLKHVGKLREVNRRRDVHLVSQRAPVVHCSLEMRFRDGRFQNKFLNLGSCFIHSNTRLKVDVINRPTIIGERGIRERESYWMHPALDRCVGVFRQNCCCEVSRFTGDFVPRISVMNDAALDLDISSGISK